MKFACVFPLLPFINCDNTMLYDTSGAKNSIDPNWFWSINGGAYNPGPINKVDSYLGGCSHVGSSGVGGGTYFYRIRISFTLPKVGL